MSGRVALDHALELTQSPHLAAAMRSQDLPDDVIIPIRIAAGCSETRRYAAEVTQLQPDAICEAARTYLQLVLFSDDGDCFRILGVRPGASPGQMREHMRWLLQWLHPDHNSGEWESVYAERVIRAWREAKTRTVPGQDRHQGPDDVARKHFALNKSEARTDRRLRAPMRWVPLPIKETPKRLSTPLRIGALVLALGLTILIVPRLVPMTSWFEPPGIEGTVDQ